MENFYTDMWSLMRSVKYNMISYSAIKECDILTKIKSWPIGYVFSDTVLPAITIFPVSKTFSGEYSGSKEIVEYRFYIYIYSPKRMNMRLAKEFSLRASDDVKKCIKKNIRMIGKDTVYNCFSTIIENEDILEVANSDREGFSSKAVLQVMCRAYHEISTDRIYYSTIQESDYNTFFNKVANLIHGDIKDSVGSWVSKVTEMDIRLKSPSVAFLPGNEYLDERRSNQYMTIVRPVAVSVLTTAYPRTEVVKRNINIADEIVSALEKYYMVEGHAQKCSIISIDYSSPFEYGFTFTSTINASYESRNRYEINYNY